MSSFSFSLEYQPPYFPVTFISADESFSRVLSLSEEHPHNSIFFIVQKEEKESSSCRKYLGILARKNLSKYTQDSEDNDSLKAENLDLLPIVSIKKSELTNLFIVLYKFISSGSDYLAIINDNSDIIGVLAHEDLRDYIEVHTKLNYQEMEKLVSELNITITEDISEKKADNKQEKIFTKNKNQDSQATTKNNSDTIFHLYKIISEHREQERYWHKLIEGAAAISGKDFFYKIAEYISINFDVDYVFITEKKEQYLETLVFLVNGKIQNNFCFPCTNFPCGKAVQEGIFTCQNNLRSLFPNNEFLEKSEMEGFAGVQLINGNKEVIGGLSVGSKSFISKIKLEMIANILQVFAARITSELEREKAVTELTNLQQQLKNEIIIKTTQLEINERKYRTLIENFPGIVYSCLNDNFWTMEFLSGEILNITGYYPEEVTGNKLISYADLIHPDDRDIVNELIQESLQKKEIFTVEYRLQHRDGHIRWVYEKGQGVYDFQGNLIHLCGAIIDVSDRKLAEEALKHSEKDLFNAKEMLELVLNTIPQRVFWKNTQSVLLGCNQAFANDFDSTVSELQGKHTSEICFNSEDAHQYQQCDCEVINTGEPIYHQQYTYHRRDGSTMYIEGSKFPLKNNEGEIIGILGTYQDITQRKEYEAKLAQENNFNQQILENMAEGLCVCSEISDFPYICFSVWNHKMEEITGYTLEEINQKGWYQSLYPDPDLREKAIERMKRMRQGEHIHKEIWRIIRADSQPRLIQISTCIVQKMDNSTHILALMQDVTEQKRAEKALKQSESRYRKIVETANEGIWILNKKGITTFVNQTLADMLGYSIENIWGKSFLSFMKDSQKVVAQQLFEKRIRGVSEQHDFQFVRADGSPLWGIVSTSPIFNDEGEFIGALGMITDISDRKLIESHINELSKRLQLAVESAQIGIWELDLKTQKLTWDEQMYKLYDIPIGTPCYYKTWTNTLHPEDFEDTVNLFERASLDLAKYDTVFRVIHSDGKIIYIKANGMLEKDGEGKPLKMIGINYDITPQKEAEIVLRESNENLEKINIELEKTTRMKDEFLASMSHELRTPLNSILGLSEALKEQVFGTLNQKQLDSLNNIHRSGGHLLDLINDILDLAKIESGKTEFNFSLVDVVSLSLDSLNFIRYLAEKKNITLTFINEIPSSHKLCQIDDRRIRQALINLLNNGIKFTPEGGKIKLKINLVTKINSTYQELETGETFIHFSVTDTGIGIAEENISKLFQTFVQIDSRLNRQYAGTGLGLALVKRIVDAHGGFVGVESEINQGSCFSFYLPYSKDVKEYHSAFWHPNNPYRVNLFTKKKIKKSDESLFYNRSLEFSSNNSKQKTAINSINNLILLVDDDEENIYAISDYLQIKGFSLEVAKNGKDALNKLKDINPCIILMDIQMPELDGFETIRLIKENPRWQNIPIVAVTALAMTGDKEKCLNAGANDYLSKPFRLKDLIEKINTILS
ncbi:PAS domain S-box protein [Cyanobacterium aponinum UTEX 3221]|uniref:PAS domain S-box protein n=1 Tax=Cyanobacterium aponinum TaxID=379064 RepID=UPI002B4BA877|nr:PAS domain S-box protein [Cyanobacterium aponinum]WRL39626.1 PAS domain S-box protein [Cyanobacterium aponinum UTEX 3221]